MPAGHSPNPRALGRHAVVIGGSMAGLLAARVLSDRFERVTVLDRDTFPAVGENRRGVPQGWHGHGLLASGLRLLARWFPDLERDLVQAGAAHGDVVGNVRWYQHGCYKAKFDSGLTGLVLSRPLLEVTVRRHVMARSNVHVTPNTHVLGLVMDEARTRVTGIRVLPHGGSSTRTYDADLVVDASGRGTRTPAWLDQFGFGRPRVDEVTVGLGYTTRTFRRLAHDLDGDLGAIIAPTPPKETRAGFILAMEGDRWIVSLCGWMGDHAPPTPSGFLAFAKSLGRPDIYDIVRQAVPLTDPVAFAFPANIRRRYEHMARLPERFIAMGDAVACFNPIYGQGMSVAALQSAELEGCLDEVEGLTWLGRRFFVRAAKVIDIPWTMAVGGDFAFDGVTGPRPAGTSLVNWYIDRVHHAAATDRVVCRSFFDVANLLAPPTALFHPRIVARVVKARLTSRLTAAAAPSPAPRPEARDLG